MLIRIQITEFYSFYQVRDLGKPKTTKKGSATQLARFVHLLPFRLTVKPVSGAGH